MLRHIFTGLVSATGFIALTGFDMAFAQTLSHASQMETCPIRIDFNMDDAADYWRTVNDGVMGGRSSGGVRFENGIMVFAGNINTNGGGFSSIRAYMERGALDGTEAIKMKIRSDGRGYKLSLRTNATYRGRSIAFQASLPKTPVNEWSEVTVPYADLRGSVFGRPVNGADFDKSDAKIIGLILADGDDGPFKLGVEWLEAC